MRKIGEGYYYSVYELSQTRVVKKQTGSKSKLIKLILWYAHNPVLLLKKISTLKQSATESILLSKKLAEIADLKEILGNPVFINDFEYQQDKAVPLESLSHSKDEKEFLLRVQEYIDANILLWRFGYGEIVYNFTLNAGISAVTDRVILLDFNELTRSKERLIEDIQTKKWSTQASMRGLKKWHPALQHKVQALLESAFTLETVEKTWKREI